MRARHRLTRKHRKAVISGAALLAVTGISVAATAAMAGTEAQALPAQAVGLGAATVRITLITGDTVGLDRDGRVTGVLRGKERSGVGISVQRLAGHTFVIPSDAIKVVASGRLDRRLFDVTQLLADGYDDAHRKQLPLIVAYQGGQRQKADAQDAKDALAATDADVQRQLPAVHGESLTTDKQDATQVWQALTDPAATAGGGGGAADAVTTTPGIARVWLDARVSVVPQAAATGDDDGAGTAQMGAPDAWKAGYDGKGVKIAVLDTGVDATHPDLAGAIIAKKDFSGSGTTDDTMGHGTHVASTIAGSGADSSGTYKGVAPGAKLLIGKVLSDSGGDESGIIAGMQWAVAQGAKVINMSLGGTDTYGTDPLEKAVNDLSASSHVLFAIAAGNDGPSRATVGSPGSAAAAITVAAVGHDDSLASFSSRGPTADNGLKPDISAPGVDIVGAKAEHGVIGDPTGTRSPKGYVTMSGTSMATPHIAGAAAILAQEHPDWTGEQIKAALMGSVKANPDLTPYEQGSGRVDLTRAITQNVTAEPASVAFGTQAWPHTNDTPVSRTLTYRNTGTQDVTLDLAAAGSGTTPAGMFTVTPARLTVPAGGTATATVTADTSTAPADGAYAAAVTATSSTGTVVRTPALITREAESYNVTIKSIGSNGKAPDYAQATVVGADNRVAYRPYEDGHDPDGYYTATVRLPKGRYLIDDLMLTGGKQAVLVAPAFDVTKDTTLVLDQRKARPVKITTPDPKAVGTGRSVIYGVKNSDGDVMYSNAFDGSDTTLAQIGPAAPKNRFLAQFGGAWTSTADKPVYDIVVSRHGSFFTGLKQTVRRTSMARVDTAIGSPTGTVSTEHTAQWATPGWSGVVGPGITSVYHDAPQTAAQGVHYVSTGSGLRWSLGLDLYGTADPFAVTTYTPVSDKRYEPGRTYRETFNTGVFGPVMSMGRNRVGIQRSGEGFILCTPMLSDGSGHATATRTAKLKTVLTTGGRTILSTTTDPCDAAEPFTGLSAKKTTYKLTVDSTRSLKKYKVSDHVTATWTFSSQHTDPTRLSRRVPLDTVRFTPGLSLAATARAGQKFTVPVQLQGPAAATGGLRSLTVRVSYDGGRTWHRTDVHTDSTGKRFLTLNHPSRPGTVSFRADLADTKGGTVSETIHNAYRTVR